MDDLKGIKSIRETGFFKQFWYLLWRCFVGFFREKLFVGAVFGNAAFACLLIASIYYNTGAVDLSWDTNSNKKIIKDWMGLAFYIGNDVFSWSVMSQVIPIPIRVPLYRKERLAGMYSAHSYYWSLFLGQNILTLWYPIIVACGCFPFLGFKDQSFENFMEFFITCIMVGLAGSTFGFMWGSIFKNDVQATTSSIVYLLVSALGAGQFVNLSKPSWVVTFISNTSPIRYAVERVFRRVLSGNDMWKPTLLQLFGFNKGDEECLNALLFICILFLTLGWFVLIYKTSKL